MNNSRRRKNTTLQKYGETRAALEKAVRIVLKSGTEIQRHHSPQQMESGDSALQIELFKKNEAWIKPRVFPSSPTLEALYSSGNSEYKTTLTFYILCHKNWLISSVQNPLCPNPSEFSSPLFPYLTNC